MTVRQTACLHLDDCHDTPKPANVSAYKLITYLSVNNPDLSHHVGLMVINPPARNPMSNPWVAVIIYHDDGVPSLHLSETNMVYFAFQGTTVTAVHGVLMGMELACRAAGEFPLTTILANYPEYQASPVVLDGGEITTVTTTATSSATTASSLTKSPQVTLSCLTAPVTTPAQSPPTAEIDSIRQSVQALTLQTSILLQLQLKNCRSEIRDLQARIDSCEPGSATRDRLQAELDDAENLLRSINSITSLSPTDTSSPTLLLK